MVSVKEWDDCPPTVGGHCKAAWYRVWTDRQNVELGPMMHLTTEHRIVPSQGTVM